jgi:16S rRNA (guanine527-N7)-methyltransferase
VTSAVSRETPPPPAAAAAVFGDSLERAVDYAGLLASIGVERGLLGPREVPRIWDRHLLNCAVAASIPSTGSQVADVGSGAGLPGLVWAIQRPDLAVTLIEPMLRRVRFLEEAVEDLGLANAEVVRARAEELHPGRRFDVVTARAVAPLERLGRWCLPLVQPGGTLAAFKGENAQAELEAAASTLRRLGATDSRVATYGEDVMEFPTRVVLVSVPTRVSGTSDG